MTVTIPEIDLEKLFRDSPEQCQAAKDEDYNKQCPKPAEVKLHIFCNCPRQIFVCMRHFELVKSGYYHCKHCGKYSPDWKVL